MAADNDSFLAIPLNSDPDCAALTGDLFDRHTKFKLDAVAGHRSMNDGGGICVIARQDSRGPIEYCHSGSEACKRLCHLAADRSCPQNDQVLRQFSEIPDRLVGEIAGIGESGDGGGNRPTAGGNHRPPEAQRHPADGDCVRTGERPFSEEDIDAEIAKAGSAIDRRDVGAQRAHPLHHSGKVARTRSRWSTEAALGFPRSGPTPGSGDDPL